MKITQFALALSFLGSLGCLTACSTEGGENMQSEHIRTTRFKSVVASAVPMEVARLSGVTNNTWQTVTLGRSYENMVVVATPHYDPSAPPLVTRVRNASGNSFEISTARFDNSSADAPAIDVTYFVVEAGVYDEATHGITLEAAKYDSTVTDSKGSWNAETRSLQGAFSNPVVLGQVMTSNDPSPSVFWSRGTGKGSAPTSADFRVGKHVGEDPNKNRMDETVGYVVFEAGQGSIGRFDFEAALGGDSIRGMGNAATSYPRVNQGPNALNVASHAAMDGGDGGWAVIRGETDSDITLAIDEDQLSNSERNHTTEQVGYVSFLPQDICGDSNCQPSECTADASGPGIFEGDLTVQAASDLSALEGQWCVTGHLDVQGTSLTDLTRLSDLVAVKGRFSVTNNDALTNFSGLGNLRSAGLFQVQSNSALLSFHGLNSLETLGGLSVGINNSLVDLSALAQTSLRGSLSVSQNGALTSLSGLQGVTSNNTSISIANNGALADIQALSNLTSVVFDLFLINNDSLETLHGLENLSNVGRTLRVSHHDSLTNGDALMGATSIGSDLQVYANPLLDECLATMLESQSGTACSNCAGGAQCSEAEECHVPLCESGACGTGYAPAGTACSIGACNNEGTCVRPECVPGASGPGIIDGDVMVDGIDTTQDLQALEGVWCVTGDLVVVGTELTDLSALSSLTHVGDSLAIRGNSGTCYTCPTGHDNLVSLTGLENLSSVGALDIGNNPNLSTLAPLSNLEAPTAYVYIRNNDSLTDLTGLSSSRLSGLAVRHNDSLTSYNGLQADGLGTVISYNNPLLSDISALSATSSALGNGLYLRNLALTDLSGLENIESIGAFNLEDMPNLVDISQVSGKPISRSVHLEHLPQLTSIAALSGAADLSDYYGVTIHHAGLQSLEGLENLRTADRLSLYDLPAVTSLAPLAGVAAIPYVTIGSLSASSLVGLESIPATSVNLFDMPITSCDVPLSPTNLSLTDMPLLDDVSCLSGSLARLSLDNCHSLTDFSGSTLSQLDSLEVQNCSSLANFSGLESLQSLTELRLERTGIVNFAGLGVSTLANLSVMENPNLQSFVGLESLLNVGRLDVHFNQSLLSLDGLEGIEWTTSSPSFWGNSLLPQCSIDAWAAGFGQSCEYCDGNDMTAVCE